MIVLFSFLIAQIVRRSEQNVAFALMIQTMLIASKHQVEK